MQHVVSLIRSPSLSDVAEYAYAATAPAAARLIFLAGACPLNQDGSTAAPGDHARQAAVAVENLRTALADAGASLDDVISTRVLVASARQQDLVAAWEVVRDAFGSHDVPSTLLGVTVLATQISSSRSRPSPRFSTEPAAGIVVPDGHPGIRFLI